MRFQARHKAAVVVACALVVIATGALWLARRAELAARRPNVVLILVDALRADHLGCYGYGRDTSPHLDALAAQGVVFEDAMAQGPETILSVPSLLTGRYPPEHGLLWGRERGGIVVGPRLELPSLAEMLARHGYQTAAISGSPVVGKGTGLDRGFQYFDQTCGQAAVWQHRSAANINQRAYQWLDQYRPRKGPFFLYLHYMDPHHNYQPPKRFAIFGEPGYTERDRDLNERLKELRLGDGLSGLVEEELRRHHLSAAEFRRLSDLYDGEVRCADHYVGELLRELERRNLYDHTVVIITADHGESFLEHGNIMHGGSLYQELLHVPLIMRAPGVSGGRRIAALVELVDVVPTVLEATGVKPTSRLSGDSLYGLLRGRGDATDGIGLAQRAGTEPIAFALRRGAMKLIVSSAGRELYDLQRDPRESQNLAPHQPETVERMAAELRQMLSELPRARGARRAGRQDLEMLKSLGYIQ